MSQPVDSAVVQVFFFHRRPLLIRPSIFVAVHKRRPPTMTLHQDTETIRRTTDRDENAVVDDEIVIEDFSATPTHHVWTTMNDPVMGGRSTSSVTIEDGSMVHFRGHVANVPFLHVPGFVTMVSSTDVFPNISHCSALAVTLRTNVDYAGYYLSFGTVHVPGGGHARGYKTPLPLAPSSRTDESSFIDLILPFSSFSSKWYEATGKIQVPCQDDTRYCPTVESLTNLQTISFWGEGYVGDVSLDVRSIRAVGCASNYMAAAAAAAVAPSVSPFWLGFVVVLAVAAFLHHNNHQRRAAAYMIV